MCRDVVCDFQKLHSNKSRRFSIYTQIKSKFNFVCELSLALKLQPSNSSMTKLILFRNFYSMTACGNKLWKSMQQRSKKDEKKLSRLNKSFKNDSIPLKSFPCTYSCMNKILSYASWYRRKISFSRYSLQFLVSESFASKHSWMYLWTFSRTWSSFRSENILKYMIVDYSTVLLSLKYSFKRFIYTLLRT